MSEGVLIALIIAGFSLLGSIVNGIMMYRSKRIGNNPHPCKDHADWLKELDNKLDNLSDRVSRIEGKLNSR